MSGRYLILLCRVWRRGLQAEEQATGEGRPQRKRRLRSSIGGAEPAGKRQRGADEDADEDADVGNDMNTEEEGVVLMGKRARTTVDYR